MYNCHRRSQGVQWVHLHPPRAVKNFFRPNLQEKCVSAPPQDTKCTPSQSKTFLVKKVHPRRQNPGYAYDNCLHGSIHDCVKKIAGMSIKPSAACTFVMSAAQCMLQEMSQQQTSMFRPTVTSSCKGTAPQR